MGYRSHHSAAWSGSGSHHLNNGVYFWGLKVSITSFGTSFALLLQYPEYCLFFHNLCESYFSLLVWLLFGFCLDSPLLSEVEYVYMSYSLKLTCQCTVRCTVLQCNG